MYAAMASALRSLRFSCTERLEHDDDTTMHPFMHERSRSSSSSSIIAAEPFSFGIVAGDLDGFVAGDLGVMFAQLAFGGSRFAAGGGGSLVGGDVVVGGGVDFPLAPSLCLGQRGEVGERAAPAQTLATG